MENFLKGYDASYPIMLESIGVIVGFWPFILVVVISILLIVKIARMLGLGNG